MKLDVPPLLKAQLVDDWEYVTKDNQVLFEASQTIRQLTHRRV